MAQNAKKSKATNPVTWQEAPEDHDFPAAASFLSLVLSEADATALSEEFRTAESAHFKAKDILRAARLELLAADNAHVASDLHKVGDGKSLSPVLLVRGDARTGRPAVIADGYHRVCASYHVDENTDVPVRIVDLPSGHPSDVTRRG